MTEHAAHILRIRLRYICKRKMQEINKRKIYDWNDKDLALLDQLLNEEADALLA